MIILIFLVSLLGLNFGSPVDKVARELNQLDSEPIQQNDTKVRKLPTIILEEATLIKNWPTDELIDYLGQISGLSFCPKGFLYIFHRADREMNDRIFDEKNRYVEEENGPIKEKTILKMNNKITEPRIVDGFGDNLFYLPHGIFADKNYIWTTDLALHQVFRFPHGSKKPDLILGEKFVPGSDNNHFCKPAHAVTASDGSLFVADGYCNSRIMKFDQSGQFIMQFGDQMGDGQLNIPHHLVIIDSKDLICVADRENYRIQCYSAGIRNPKSTGEIKKIISDVRFGPIYAIGFNEKNNIMYIISGITDEVDKSQVYLYNWDNDIITGSINFPGPYGFGMAHTISVCPRHRCLAIGSLTKECPADEETCLARAEDDENYLSRNIWLYELMDEKVAVE